MSRGGGKREGEGGRGKREAGSGKREAGNRAGRDGSLTGFPVPLPSSLFDIPAEVELGPRKANDPIEAGLHFGREIAPSH